MTLLEPFLKLAFSSFFLMLISAALWGWAGDYSRRETHAGVAAFWRGSAALLLAVFAVAVVGTIWTSGAPQ